MSSWRTPPNSRLMQAEASPENGPRAKCDQVVFEAIAKAAEIVVGSRCWIDPHILQMNNPSGSTSSRFNLLVPEVQGVRSILQRWKRALHVPLRLDVYFQHEDSRRELLERWCLEYAPKSPHQHQMGDNSLGASTSRPSSMADPIVQLRRVCKQIVIWLRSLYCWSRMLPAQALRKSNSPQPNQSSTIGFSIYVVSEGNDDVSGLVSNQGFLTQSQPHSVWTPYGELGWRVFYAPQSMIQRFIPQSPPYAAASTSSSSRPASQPIPMRQQRTKSQPIPQNPRELHRRDTTPPTTVQSAPHYHGRMYQRSYSDVGETNTKPVVSALNPSSGLPSFVKEEKSVPLSSSTNSRPPTKTLSGLSLALMMSEGENNSEEGKRNQESNTTNTTDEAAEKRRAALHHAPPNLTQSPVMKKSLATAGEYGYAYNNQIPTLRTNVTNLGGGRITTPEPGNYAHNTVPASPSLNTPLSSTPPGYLLGGPTPPAVVPSNLIPPRSAVTPPFTRPMGFVGEAPRQPSPQTGAQAPPVTAKVDHQHHMTSLDLLHSSPFQQQPHFGSIFSSHSSSIPPAVEQPFSSLTGDPHSFLHSRHDAFSDGFSPQRMGGPLHHSGIEDDMPFAVDTGTSSSIQADASAAAMASFAVSTTTKRLALFESSSSKQEPSTGLSGDSDPITSLADQLAEFKSFGASLSVPGPSEHNVSDAGASTSTPISMRS